jgi:hypothetical protein
LQGGVQNRLYVSADYLLWWTKGDQLPALVTTSPAGTAFGSAGVLGLPTTSILFGGDEANDEYRSGARVTLGAWLDPYQRAGIEVTYLALGNSDQSANFNSTATPILAIPYTNVLTGNPDSIAVGFTSPAGVLVSQGTIGVSAVSRFDTIEALLRRNIYQNGNTGIDFVAGYRYARLSDTLTMNDAITGVGQGGIVPVGTTLAVMDRFDTANNFNGVDLGFNGQIRKAAWTVDWLMKLGLGATSSRTTINGTTSRNGATPVPGGLFALSSNIGDYSGSQFSMMPELGLTLGYDITSRLRATMGYSFIYWSQVHRAGEQVDTNVNPDLFPPPVVPRAGPLQPQFLNATSDFWAQGLNWGLEYSF